VHDEVQCGHPSLVNDDLVHKVKERVCDDRRLTIFDLSLHFPQISRTHRRRPPSMRRVYKNLCTATISASILAANMLKNSLKNVEPNNNKILYETLLHFFTAKWYLLSE
jgi:hypothetical protein